MRAPAAFALALLLLSALPAASERDARASDLWPLIKTDEADLDKTMNEIEAQLGGLDELAKGYPASRDLETTASTRAGIRKRAGDLLAVGLQLYFDLRAMTKQLDIRRADQLMSEAMSLRAYARAHRKEAAGRAADSPWKGEINDLMEAERYVGSAWRRLGGFQYRLAADEESFARERKARADIRRMRLGAAAGAAALLLVTAWALWRRRRARA
jgi:hypothetical protein